MSETGPSVGQRPLLSVTDLRVELAGRAGVILDDVSLSVEAGQVVGVVGESGSGKTTLALALFGYSRRGTRISGGAVSVAGVDVLSQSAAGLSRLRGRLVSYVPQDPAAALNPARRIGVQLAEAVTSVDQRLADRAVADRVGALLDAVHLPSDEAFRHRYPHQLSGGQMQRVVIAMALAGDPPLLVMDEPTTALDVTTQARILTLVKELATTRGLGIVYVTHDLAVVAGLADRIAVMYGGWVVETGVTGTILGSPQHPYTRGLIAAAPELEPGVAVRGMSGRAPDPTRRGAGCLFAPRCDWAVPECRAGRPPLVAGPTGSWAACIRVAEVLAGTQKAAPAAGPNDGAPAGVPTGSAAGEEAVLTVSDLVASYRGHQVVHEVALSVPAGRCLAVVGESGSGKTTLARAIAGLHREAAGRVALSGQPLSFVARRRPPAARLAVQYVFQNPYASLNPRRTIERCISQPLRYVPGLSPAEARQRVISVLDAVELPAELLSAYPDELSGGQRQRVAIARALVVSPRLLICDEVTSALDVSVQAAVIETLLNLKTAGRLTMLFITHNIALASGIADDILVLKDGRVVEQAATATLVRSPSTDYGRTLIRDTPSLESALHPVAGPYG